MKNRDLPANELTADPLTWREQDVLNLLAEHLTNREIAGRLNLAESTVKDYVGRILGKLHVKNRREAVERARALGLLNGGPKPTRRPTSRLPRRSNPLHRPERGTGGNQTALGRNPLADACGAGRHG